MRDQLTNVLLEDFRTKRYSHWPNFEYLGEYVYSFAFMLLSEEAVAANNLFLSSVSTYGELWAGTPESADHLAIVFERSNESFVGAQVGAGRCFDIEFRSSLTLSAGNAAGGDEKARRATLCSFFSISTNNASFSGPVAVSSRIRWPAL